MKKLLFIILLILLVVSIFASENNVSDYQWTPTKDENETITGGSGSRDFIMYFILSSEDNSTYTDVGFSSTPFNTTTGTVTKYENNSLLMNASINPSTSPLSVDLTGQIYSYWHVAIEKPYKIQLIVEPKANVSVTGTYTQYTQGSDSSFSSSTVLIQNESKNPITSATTFDLVSFSKLGRHLGSSLISIEANVTNAYFEDDVVCVLTLSLVSV